MVKAASNEQLAAGFKEHLEQTKEHAVRLEKILTSHNRRLVASSEKASKAC
jgi:ferritin-like metal-binding protein YciE